MRKYPRLSLEERIKLVQQSVLFHFVGVARTALTEASNPEDVRKLGADLSTILNLLAEATGPIPEGITPDGYGLVAEAIDLTLN